jgi:1-deoxy-D-xylulose-5-phosphate reductoisomerase
MKNIAILGSTGSIGKSTLDVIARHPDLYSVYSLTAARSVDIMFEQCQAYRPVLAVMADAFAARQLELLCLQAGLATQVMHGDEAMIAAVTDPSVDSVMAAIVGAAGLLPTLAAAKAGKTLLLANKEALVMSGELLLQIARENGSTILPIDSEHNAIFQCLPPLANGQSTHQGLAQRGVSRIVLTASGGPFLRYSREQLVNVTPDQACAHPKWSMGRKISTDSATLMNKGLELIEAQLLFDMPSSALDVIVHPQSIIHSMVDYCDGSMLAQLGNPDMRTPIAQALAYPNRFASGVAALDLARMGSLDFEAPDLLRFPCLQLAFTVAQEKGNRACILNAANEIAVGAFLGHRMPFLKIPEVIEKTLERLQSSQVPQTVDAVVDLDAQARSLANSYL